MGVRAGGEIHGSPNIVLFIIHENGKITRS